MLSASVLHSDETGIYRIPVFDYVTGRFDPAQHSLFVNLDHIAVPAARKNMFLRKRLLTPLK